MELDQRVALLEQLASGDVALRDLTGLERQDLGQVLRLGVSAFLAGRHEQARVIFVGLEALEPDVAAHTLRRAQAEAALGQTAEAIEALTRFLDSEALRSRGELIEALLLRAKLTSATDPDRAATDIAAAGLLGAEGGHRS